MDFYIVFKNQENYYCIESYMFYYIVFIDFEKINKIKYFEISISKIDPI